MALITCPECGKEISSRASACPHCGLPLSSAGDYAAVLLDCTVDYREGRPAVAPILAQHQNCSPEEALALLDRLPLVLGRSIPYADALALCDQFQKAGAQCKIVADVQADHPDTLASVPPAAPPDPRPPEARPLSFGGTLGAVILGTFIVRLFFAWFFGI